MALIGSLVDDFATNDQTKWTDLAAVTVTGGRLQLATNSGYDGERRSAATYDLTGSSACVQMVQAPSILTGAGLVETYFMLYATNTNNSVFWDVQSGTINARRRVSSTSTTMFTATYDPAVHKWLRIRHSGGTIFWDSSVDGATWTNRASWVVSGLTITAMTVLMGAGRDSGITATPALYDNFNLPPATGTLVSRWTGAVTQTGATVAVDTSGATTARLKVATDAALTTSVVFGAAATPDSNGETKLTVTGLTAGTQYHYGVEVDGAVDTGKQGKFRTAPSGQANFSFAFGSCNSAGHASTVFPAIEARNPDFFLHLGDFAYKDPAANDASIFRTMYDEALAGSTFGPFLANVPTSYVWSDHDYGPNDSDSTNVAKPAAQSVYRLKVPHYPLPVSDSIQQTFTWGRVRFIMCDARSHKSPKGNVDDASKTLLGAAQKQWLKDTITSATEKLIFVSFDIAYATALDGIAGNDGWGGYHTERMELARFVASSGKPVIILGGDTHSLAADDGTNSPGGIPTFRAAPLDGTSSPWLEGNTSGEYPLTAGVAVKQYGMVTVTDTGTTIAAAFTGYDAGGTARITQTTTFAVDTGRIVDVWTGAALERRVREAWDGTRLRPAKLNG